LIRALAAEGHEVTVATLWSSAEERAAIDELKSVGINTVACRLPAGRLLWNCLGALPSRDPLQASYSWSPHLAKEIGRLATSWPADVVHVEHLRGVRYGLALADALSERRSARPAIVWDSVDCISSLFRHAAVQGLGRRVRVAAKLELPRTEQYEGRVVAGFDRVIVTSEIDRRDLLELNRRSGGRPPRIDVIPNGVDLEYFAPSLKPRDPMTLVITGKMSYHANAIAVMRFVEDVMPLVWSDVPQVRLLIVGKDPTREILKLAELSADGHGTDTRIVVTGTVPDIRPFLHQATVAVAPIQYGVGIQNKVLEALACATPVVATPQAVSALGARTSEELLVGTTPHELATAIVSLLRDPLRAEHLGKAGRALVERQHDWRVLAGRLSQIYRLCHPLKIAS
jgi:glycosyltransferase involved in cell wall biosynthesis